jgi:hypothetical protein
MEVERRYRVKVLVSLPKYRVTREVVESVEVVLELNVQHLKRTNAEANTREYLCKELMLVWRESLCSCGERVRVIPGRVR